MFYDFARDITLDEARQIVARHNERLGVNAFIMADKGEYIVFNYVVQFDGAWLAFNGDPVNDREAAIIRECRGLTFSKETGKVVARKFHKFFGVGQTEETQPHLIDWTQPHDILLKEDGSMITPYRRAAGDLDWHTKMGATDVAKLAVDFVANNPQYVDFANYCIDNGLTPMFEFCSRKQKIVVDYAEDKLVLLAIRDNRTGAYIDYASLDIAGDQFGIPVVERIEGSVTDVQAFLDAVRVLKGQEGYVVRFHNGHMAKVKAEDYLRLHNMVDMLQREKNVLGLIFSESIDDAKALMTDDSRERVERFIEAVDRGMAETANRLKEMTDRYVALSGGDKKKLAVEYVNTDAVASSERGMVFQIAQGRNALDVVRNMVSKSIGSASKVDEIRSLIGGAKWDDFRDATVVIDD